MRVIKNFYSQFFKSYFFKCHMRSVLYFCTKNFKIKCYQMTRVAGVLTKIFSLTANHVSYCAPVSVKIDPKGIQGTIFQLSKTGDVTWKIPGDAVPTPLLKCDTYVVVSKKQYLPNTVLKFGAYKGHVIDCIVKTFGSYIDIISINDGWCLLLCEKFEDINQEDPFELPFSFLPALRDSYFSDIIIKADNNKEFEVHTCILKLSLPEADWSSKPTPLSNLSEDVIFTILHFLYAQCLPTGLKESTAQKVISAASQIPGLEPLVLLCCMHCRNLTVKNQIFSLVTDIHTCASQIIEYFSNKQSRNPLNDLSSDPAKLCFAVKNSMREVAVAASKFLMICDLYTRQKNELSKEDSHEIILYAKSRIPVFISQFESFLQAVKATFSDLLPSQRQELACYLVPEVETVFDIISSLLIKVKAFLDVMVAECQMEEEINSQKILENLEQYTDSALHRKTLKRLLGVIHRISSVLLHLHQKKENFKLMTNGNKIRSVARNLEQLMEQLPIFVLRVKEFSSALDEKLQWNEFQFCFKVGTSKVSEVVKKLLRHKESLQSFLLELCDFVQRDSFSQSLVALGLLQTAFLASVSSSEGISKVEYVVTSSKGNSQMSLKDSICVPPPAPRNHLSEAASELLISGENADMVFEVITSDETDSLENQSQENSAELLLEPKLYSDVCKMAAHRVIVASRCDWFRRALLSGMQEDINRKIQVHNTSPYLFSLFLKYLYSGQLDFLTLSVDHISELLLLSDRYELDSLKHICEYNLKLHLDADSVLNFYIVADRFNAKILKSSCEDFITEHSEVIDSEFFKELPDNLQSEVFDLLFGKSQTIGLPLDRALSYSMTHIEDMIANVHINSNLSTPENDETPLSQDFLRLEATLEQLREIVGHGMSSSQLVQIILAADYDLNRALNFYYSSS